jgi:protein YIPF6
MMALSRADQADYFFASVFVLVWCGAGVVTLNGQLLGGKLTFFQSVCILGYCLSPLVIACFLCIIINIGFLKPIFILVLYLWACRGTNFPSCILFTWDICAFD